jgi:hypothetical protein
MGLRPDKRTAVVTMVGGGEGEGEGGAYNVILQFFLFWKYPTDHKPLPNKIHIYRQKITTKIDIIIRFTTTVRK